MKRVIAAVMLLLLLAPTVLCAGAAGDFTCEYTPKSANSSLFYIDVYSSRELTAAVFELSFDDSMVSYYSASAVNSTATVRDNLQDGKVTAAFADTGAVSGKLCRFSFKALQAGSVSFVLHMEQAAGADRTLTAGWNDFTLTLTLGKEDTAAASSGSRTRSSGRSPVSSSASSRSSKSAERSYFDAGGAEDGREAPPDVYDMRKSSPVKWILIGAGLVVLVGALVLTGFFIGKRSKAPQKKEEPGEESPEPKDEEEKSE